MEDDEWQGFVEEVQKSSEGESTLRAQENKGQVAEDDSFDVDIHGGFKRQEDQDKFEKKKIDSNPLLKVQLLQQKEHLHKHARTGKQHVHRHSRARAGNSSNNETALLHNETALLEEGQVQSQGSQASMEGGLGEMDDDEEWQGFVEEVKKSNDGESTLRAQENKGQVAEDDLFDVDIHGGFKRQEEQDKYEKKKVDSNPLLKVQLLQKKEHLHKHARIGK